MESISYSELVKRARLSSGLSPDVFACQVHTSVSSLYKWENGTSKPNAESMMLILALADWLDLPADLKGLE